MRTVRLTIEINYTNRYQSSESLPIAFCLASFSATVAIVSFALYISFPVSVFGFAYYRSFD